MSASGQSSRPSFSFDGLKFWISILVPQRIEPLVKKHNGIVVKGEHEADVLIVDPKRAVTRPGISHVWVEDCIRNKRRIDEERYRVMPPGPREQAQSQAIARQVAALQTTTRRRQRNFFTPEDDRILIEWLRKEQRIAQRNRASFNIKGNAIYMSLADSHPNHSYHSWRDRWIRHLSRIVSLDNQPSQPSPSPVPAENGETAGARTADNEEQEAEQEAEPVQLFFMQKPHYFIVKRTYMHYQATKNGHAPSEAEFFESLHETFPTLTADEWREEYRKIKSWYEYGFSQDDSFEAGTPGDGEAALPVANEEPPAASADASQSGVTAHDGETVQEVQGQEQEPTVDADLDLDDDAILDGINSQIDKQQEFLGKLETYNEYTGVYVPPSFYIGGRYLETCLLWLAVEEQGVSLEDVDWPKIAESLGFNEAEHPSLWKQLAGWFHQNLKEFDNLLEQLVNEAEGEEEGEDEGEDEAEDEDGDENYEAGNREEVEASAAPEALGQGNARLSGSQPLPQQKPLGIFSSATKRLLSMAFSHSDPVQNDEGPSIPSSPSKRVRFSGMPATTANDDGNDDDNDDDDDDGDDEFEPSRQTRSAAHPAPVEPETQDFAYSEETQQAVTLGDDVAAREDANTSMSTEASTPSQQLHTEDVVVATPRAPPGRRTRGQTPTANQPAVQRAATTPRRTRQAAGAGKQG